MRQRILVTLTVLLIGMLPGAAVAWAKEKRTQPVTVASFNIFHGIDCAVVEEQLETKITQCRLAERIDLLFKHLAALGCPDIVTFQEVLDRPSVASLTANGLVTIPEDPQEALTSVLELIQEKLKPFARVCGFTYALLYAADLLDPQQGPLFQRTDEELILSRYPIEHAEVRLLHSALFVPTPPPDSSPFLRAFARHVLFTRIVDHPSGHPINVFTTHLAASEDFGDNTCHSHESFSFPNAQGTLSNITFDVACPAECDGAETVRQCEARQVGNFVKEHLQDNGDDALTVITGDFNAKPGTLVYQEVVNAEPHRPWLDSYEETGNPECVPGTGIGCTAGRVAVRGDLEQPEPNVDERIDYIFVVPPAPAVACTLQEHGTGLFADEPNPFRPTRRPCGPFPQRLCWASDHNGTRATLSCARSADRAHHPLVETGPVAGSPGLPGAQE